MSLRDLEKDDSFYFIESLSETWLESVEGVTIVRLYVLLAQRKFRDFQ